MLSQKQQRDIMAAGLLALALFLLAALIPVSVLGPRGGEWFPSGNMVGVVGETVQRLLTGLVGIAAFFLPGLLLFGGLRASEWLSVGWTARLSILMGGLLLIVPAGLGILGQDGEAVGRWGELAGPPLMTAFGFLGAVLFILLLLVMLSVGTLGWNPLRSLAHGLAQGTGVMARGARGLFSMGERLKAWWDQRSGNRLDQTPPMDLLEGDGASDSEDDSRDVGAEAYDEALWGAVRGHAGDGRSG